MGFALWSTLSKHTFLLFYSLIFKHNSFFIKQTNVQQNKPMLSICWPSNQRSEHNCAQDCKSDPWGQYIFYSVFHTFSKGSGREGLYKIGEYFTS